MLGAIEPLPPPWTHDEARTAALICAEPTGDGFNHKRLVLGLLAHMVQSGRRMHDERRDQVQ